MRQALRLAHAAVEPVQQRLGGRHLALGEHHEGDRRFTPARRGHADHSDIGDGRMLTQNRLEITRVEIEAAGNDHVLFAVNQRQEAVRIEATNVAGTDEAFTAGVEPFGFGRFLGLVQVAGHHCGGMSDDFSNRADRQLVAFIVNHTNVMPLSRTADRVQFIRVLVRSQNAGAAAFGHAVGVDQPAGPARQDFGFQCGTERRAGAHLVAEVAEIVLLEVLARHEPLVLHWHQHRMGHLVLLGEAQVFARVELAHQHHAAAQSQGWEKRHQRGVGVQRRGDKRSGLIAVSVGGTASNMGPTHGVRLHDALGLAGGAGRIDDVERPFRLDRYRLWRGITQPTGQSIRRRLVQAQGWTGQACFYRLQVLRRMSVNK